MVSDPISDFLARLRNGLMARKKEVLTNCSKMSQSIAQILESNGYIGGFTLEEEGPRKMLRVALKYDAAGAPLVDGFKRISRPGLRNYAGMAEIPVCRNGMGITIVSTSKGVMTGKEAQEKKVGGEVLCTVW